MQLLSLTLLSCPPTVLSPYYKQSIPAGLAGSYVFLLDRARTCFDRRSQFQIAYAQAMQPKLFGDTVPAAGSAFVPGATLTLHPFTYATVHGEHATYIQDMFFALFWELCDDPQRMDATRRVRGTGWLP